MGEPTDRTVTHPAHLYLDVNDTDATSRRALEAGAEPLLEPVDRFWGTGTQG